MQWDVEDDRLYNENLKGRSLSKTNAAQNSKLNAKCFICGKFGHMAATCYGGIRSNTVARAGSADISTRQVCMRFNQAACKFGDKCKCLHWCSTCGEGHPAVKCMKSSR